MSRRGKLEKKYIELKNQTTPDLWNRIEAGLEPKSCMNKASAPENRRLVPGFGMSAAVLASLAVICLCVHMFSMTQHSVPSANAEEGAAAKMMAAETTAAGTRAAEEHAVISARNTEMRFVSYDELSLAPMAAQPDPVLVKPSETVEAYAADSMYFSEDILADTQLLCQATVTSVTYEADGNGVTCALNYEIVIDKVLYSEDYAGEQEILVVKSPAAPLYALLENRSYLLALKKQNGDFWLVFPSAPQPEVTLDKETIFHNGWHSLVNDEAYVVLNSQADPQDYYYDRMFLRKDADVFAELAALTEAKHQDKSNQSEEESR